MTIRILLSLVFLSLASHAFAQQSTPASTLERQAQKAHMTPAQLQEFRLKQIGDAFDEKRRETADVEASKGAGFVEEALGEAKISKSMPEAEVHAAINPMDSNNIVVSPINEAGGMALPIYYTTNFGGTWNKSSFNATTLVSGAQIWGGGDPLFAFDANGKLYYTWIDVWRLSGVDTQYGAIYWASSTDKGKTWQRSAHDAITTNWQKLSNNHASGFDDKEWLAVDRNVSSPYKNTLYMAWSRLGTKENIVMLARKLPGVDSFEAPVRVSSANLAQIQFTSIGIDTHGGIHVTFMGSEDLSSYAIYHSYSADGGKTFSPEVKIADADVPNFSSDAVGDVIYGVRSHGNYPCPHLSIDTAHTGNLYMVWNAYGTDANLGTGSQIYFSRSTDNGKTWSDTVRVNNDVQGDNVIDHFYPSIAVNAKGTIYVSWYDRREDANNKVGRYYLAQSNDHGQTWGNAAVASKAMNFAHVMDREGGMSNPSAFGIGEYTQLLVTNGYVIPVWTDDRTDNGYLSIYTSFIQASQALPSSGVAPQRVSSIDGGVSLETSYPNPASGIVHCSYSLESRGHVHATVTDVRGNTLTTVLDETATDGTHDMTFDVSALPNGTYYLTLESGAGYASRAFTVSH